MWIGANDIGNEGSFVWAEPPAPVNYTNWDAGQPDNAYGVENCVHMWLGDGKWNDLPCEHREAPQSTLCEVLVPCKN